MGLDIEFGGTPFEQGTVSAYPNRLNARAERLISAHAGLIEGKRILDLASNDGRFSWAALQAGAEHVTGIEGREHQVAKARRILDGFGLGHQSTFHAGNLFEFLRQVEPGQYDVVLNFGFVYHTIRTVELFEQMRRICPLAIVDTDVMRPIPFFRLLVAANRLRPKHLLNLKSFIRDLGEGEVMYLKPEDAASDANTIEIHGSGADGEVRGYVFKPTASAVERLLEIHGFEWERIDWRDGRTADWSNLSDYHNGSRVSYLARRVAPSESGLPVAEAKPLAAIPQGSA